VKKQILIAEDDRDLRDILRIVLTEEGFDVVTADDGQEAMNRLKDARDQKPGVSLPAMIILDLNMPIVDGWKVAAWLDGEPALRDIPVIVTSATEEHGAAAKALHADAYLVKPFSSDEILGIVELFALLS